MKTNAKNDVTSTVRLVLLKELGSLEDIKHTSQSGMVKAKESIYEKALLRQ